MSYLNDRVLDNGLAVLTAEANRLDICSALPATYAQATATFSLGNKLAPAVSAPGASGSPAGREVTISAIADGQCTGNGDAAYWALVDTVNSRLLAAAPLAAPQTVANGNPFTLTSFTIGIPQVA